MSIFTEVQKRTLPRNKFDLSFDNKLSTEFGCLVPMLCKELMPGDSVKHAHEIFVQFAPMVSLMMHRFYVRTEYFFVPNRLVYPDFNKFLVGGEDGTEILQPPCMKLSQVYGSGDTKSRAGSLADYLGVPSKGTYGSYTGNRLINSMPFRAYQLIYNEWYRDENLIQDLEIPTAGGVESNNDIDKLITLRRRAWKKDYFTSALPWPQKGPQVKIPLGEVAYVYPFAVESTEGYPWSSSQGRVDGDAMHLNETYGMNAEPGTADVKLSSGTYGASNADVANNSHIMFSAKDANDDPYLFGLVADLRAATATSIEELRRAFVIQHWLELNAIGGTREVEQIYNHFGVKVPDYRLGRPEYIAGYTDQLTIGNVYSTQSNNTSESHGIDNVQAYPVAVVNGKQNSDYFTYYAQEHGFLIGIVSVMPKAAYFQGLNRMLGRRQDKFDYYWPEFADLGEQAIFSEELYMNQNEDTVFGYTPRYAEFKFSDDEVHGEYRTSLNFHHDARIFSAEPSLNQAFIEIDPSYDDLNRIFNTDIKGSHHVYIDIFHDLSKVSSMIYFGNPKL